MLSEVLGQDAVVKSLKGALSRKDTPHAFLFTGPSGTGKTTLARTLASSLKIPFEGILEIDAATNSGISDMRLILESVRYKSLASEGGRKLLIIDECHALSKATWQSMLKSLEEPPEHVFWALCTTEGDKVPETIRTRCLSYNLKSIDQDEITTYLEEVIEREELDVQDDLIEVIAKHAHGSMRKALVYLEQLIGIEDRKEAVRLLESGVGDEEQAIALARMVCTGKNLNWANVVSLLKKLENESPEGVRLVIVNYAASMLKGGTKPEPLLAVLDAFRYPCNSSEKWAPIFLALGTLLFD